MFLRSLFDPDKFEVKVSGKALISWLIYKAKQHICLIEINVANSRPINVLKQGVCSYNINCGMDLYDFFSTYNANYACIFVGWLSLQNEQVSM